MGVVGDAELIGHGKKQRIGLGDRLVLPELLDQHVGFRRITPAEDGAVVVDDGEGVVVPRDPFPKYARSASFTSAKIDRLTDTRGSRWCPASFQAAR